jgi:Uma2 family endonuclease
MSALFVKELRKGLSTQTTTYYDIVAQMPADAVVSFNGVTWDEYEELLEQVGEGKGLRVSFDEGVLEVMTLSPKHENYAEFIKRLVGVLSLRLQIDIVFFGSMTMRKQEKQKGNEPDACFYVQSAPLIGARVDLDFSVDPPPDVAVEVDVHHDTRKKLRIYAGLGVPEVWRFDGRTVRIFILEGNGYVESEASLSLPLLTAEILTGFLKRLEEKSQFQAVLDFDEWLKNQPSGKTI